MPTCHGDFMLHAYEDPALSPNGLIAHIALVHGDPAQSEQAPLVRLHSECLTGDTFGSVRCDCGQQLATAMQSMQREGCGVLIYLRQEGRGIGLINKLKAYNLQDQGMDTVEANLHLGFEADERDYGIAIAMLEDLKIQHIRLLTNNPEKLSVFAGSSIKIVERVPLQIAPESENIAYLKTKRDRMGHWLDL